MNSVTAFADRKRTVQIMCNIVRYYEVSPLFLTRRNFSSYISVKVVCTILSNMNSLTVRPWVQNENDLEIIL
jgi:hypothetical protein